VNLAIAFGAGILSFLSPCVLPLVPAFLVNIAGEAALSGRARARTVVHAVAFVLGFSVVFTLLWVVIAIVGALAGELVYRLQQAAGVLLVVLGMHMIGVVHIGLLDRRVDMPVGSDVSGLPRSFLIGAAFGVGMTPCIGPYLGTILTMLLGLQLGAGAILLLAYALGMGVPFVIIATGLGSTGAAVRSLARHIRTVDIVGGVLVIATGLLLVSGQFTRLAGMFSIAVQ
jgi:cytochrome c-type biogenesis protein